MCQLHDDGSPPATGCQRPGSIQTPALSANRPPSRGQPMIETACADATRPACAASLRDLRIVEPQATDAVAQPFPASRGPLQPCSRPHPAARPDTSPERSQCHRVLDDSNAASEWFYPLAHPAASPRPSGGFLPKQRQTTTARSTRPIDLRANSGFPRQLHGSSRFDP